MTAICFVFTSFSAIQQFELAFEGKLRCDFIKTIIIVFILGVSYYPTLPCNFDLQFGKNVTGWFLSVYWFTRKLFLLCYLLHTGIIAAHRPYQNWRNLGHYRHQGWRKSIRGKWEGIRFNYQCQPARTLQESIYVTTSIETLPLVDIVLEVRSTL